MNKIIDKIKNIQLNDHRLILIAIIVILVLLMMDFNNRMVVLLRLNQERNQLSTQVAQFELTKISYEEQIIYATSERALEEWTREKARMIEEGDIPIIVIPPVGQVVVSTPVPVEIPEPIARWEIWQELFFGN